VAIGDSEMYTGCLFGLKVVSNAGKTTFTHKEGLKNYPPTSI
jgi:hypothetical protein